MYPFYRNLGPPCPAPCYYPIFYNWNAVYPIPTPVQPVVVSLNAINGSADFSNSSTSGPFGFTQTQPITGFVASGTPTGGALVTPTSVYIPKIGNYNVSFTCTASLGNVPDPVVASVKLDATPLVGTSSLLPNSNATITFSLNNYPMAQGYYTMSATGLVTALVPQSQASTDLDGLSISNGNLTITQIGGSCCCTSGCCSCRH